MHADETTLQVLREAGKSAEAMSYLWLYRIGSRGTACGGVCDIERDLQDSTPEERHAVRLERSPPGIGCLSDVAKAAAFSDIAIEFDGPGDRLQFEPMGEADGVPCERAAGDRQQPKRALDSAANQILDNEVKRENLLPTSP